MPGTNDENYIQRLRRELRQLEIAGGKIAMTQNNVTFGRFKDLKELNEAITLYSAFAMHALIATSDAHFSKTEIAKEACKYAIEMVKAGVSLEEKVEEE